MDIQSLGEAGTGAATPQAQSQPQAADISSTPAQAPAPGTAQPDATQSRGNTDRTLAQTVAGILGASSTDNVHVSYRIEKPDEIVTVFTNADGHEIAQVPSEAMIQIAQFFDAQTGVTLDRNA